MCGSSCGARPSSRSASRRVASSSSAELCLVAVPVDQPVGLDGEVGEVGGEGAYVVGDGAATKVIGVSCLGTFRAVGSVCHRWGRSTAARRHCSTTGCGSANTTG